MSNDDDKETIKIILIGESGVGKTNLINVSTGIGFNENEQATLISSYQLKNIEIKGITYKLSIWDTIGQEKLRSLTKIFFTNSKIAILVYDITSRHSFEELNYWEKCIKEMTDENIILGVAGNKKDLYIKEVVNEEEGENYAKSIKAKFKLTSAKSDIQGFEEFLKELLLDYISKNEEEENHIKLNNNQNNNNENANNCNC